MNADAQVLWKAADRLSKPFTWAQRAFVEPGWGGDVKRCLAGELLNLHNDTGLCPEDINNDPECILVAKVIKEQFGDRLDEDNPCECPDIAIFRFNDHEDTTQDDVVLVLKKAAIHCDEVIGS